MKKLILVLFGVLVLASACATVSVQSIAPPQAEVSGVGGD